MKISKGIGIIATFTVILSVLLISVNNSGVMNDIYRSSAVIASNGKLPLFIGNTASFSVCGAAKFIILGVLTLIIGKILNKKSDKAV